MSESKFDEAWFAEYNARRTRWQTGTSASRVVDTDPSTGGAGLPAGGILPFAPDKVTTSPTLQCPPAESTTALPISAAARAPLIPKADGASEKDIQSAILKLLDHHPRVAWSHRINTGVMRLQNKDGSERFVSFAFIGCSDILGQLKDGRFLAIECKRKGKNPTSDQLAFLTLVNHNGGRAFVARSIDDVLRELS